MKLSDKIKVKDEVLARAVGDETVMLDLAKGAYFGLDPVGARIWQLLVAGRTLAQICDVMMDEYDVPRETLERDVLKLVDQLAAHALIDPAP